LVMLLFCSGIKLRLSSKAIWKWLLQIRRRRKVLSRALYRQPELGGLSS
jgi:hypothetical protein